MSEPSSSILRAMAPGLLLTAAGIAWECYLRWIAAWPTYLSYAVIGLGLCLTGAAAIVYGRRAVHVYWIMVALTFGSLVLLYWRE